MENATEVQDVQPKQEAEKELKMTFKVSEANIILAALEELPHKVSRKIIDNMIQQAQSQLQ
jgi:hypothetical protein